MSIVTLLLPLIIQAQQTGDNLHLVFKSAEKIDVRRYEIKVQILYGRKEVRGQVIMDVITDATQLPIFLDKRLTMESIELVYPESRPLKWDSETQVAQVGFITHGREKRLRIKMKYHGKPKKSMTPPWDGGFVWSSDYQGRPWIGVAVQGEGSHLWFPSFSVIYEEPETVDLHIIVPDTLVAVGNGVLVDTYKVVSGWTAWHWRVVNPINNYNITVNVGKYVPIEREYDGLKASFWVIDKPKWQEKASQYMDKEVPQLLKDFTKLFGVPYPFPQDGYKLVYTPYWGMEHQSCVAYGNNFRKNGGTESCKFDYILVHETAHEWWGNSVTAKAWQDIWIHEGFGTYAEALLVEHRCGKAEYFKYMMSLRKRIKNKVPVAGKQRLYDPFADNDIYMKGAWILHTIRSLLNNDSLFFRWIHAIQKRYYHSHASTQDILSLLIELDSATVYNRKIPDIWNKYLVEEADVPVLYISKKKQGESTLLKYSWKNWSYPFSITFAGRTLHFEQDKGSITIEGDVDLNKLRKAIETRFLIYVP